MIIRLDRSLLCLFAMALLLIQGCGSPSASSNTVFSGRILLENQEMHDGIIVEIYDLVDENHYIPVDGFTGDLLEIPWGQRCFTNFLHEAPIASAVTDVAGSFSVSIPSGRYNVIAHKAGFSSLVAYEASFSGSTMGMSDVFSAVNMLTLLDVCSGVFSGEAVHWGPDRDVLIDGTVTFMEGSELTISPGTNIYLASGSSLNLRGSVMMQGSANNPIVFDVAPGSTADASFNQVRLFDSAIIQGGILDGLVIKNADYGLILEASNTTVRNSYLSGISNALKVSNKSGFRLENSTMVVKAEQSAYAVDVSMSSGPVISNSLIWGGNYGLRYNVASSAGLFNSCIYGRMLAMSLEFDSDATFENNLIVSRFVGLNVNLRTSFNMQFCEVNAPLGIDIKGAYTSGTVNGSNLQCSTTAIKYLAHYGGDMDAKNCFWGTAEDTRIQELIIDKNDFDSSHQYYDRYSVVLYTPYRNSLVPIAGIR